jgi:hypothetical protein
VRIYNEMCSAMGERGEKKIKEREEERERERERGGEKGKKEEKKKRELMWGSSMERAMHCVKAKGQN